MLCMSKHVELFTDGGAIKINNEYYGSCSYVIKYGKKYFTSTDPVAKGTNNFYELKGIRDGLRAIVSNWKELQNTEIWIISDSQYSISCITEWFDNWYEKNGKYCGRLSSAIADVISAEMTGLQLVKAIANTPQYSGYPNGKEPQNLKYDMPEESNDKKIL